MIDGGATGLPCPDHPTTLGVAAGAIFGINILALEGGHRAFPATSPFPHALPERPTTQEMDEQANQEIQDDNPAPTGYRSTRKPPRRRGVRAQRKPTEILAENVQSLGLAQAVLGVSPGGSRPGGSRTSPGGSRSKPRRFSARRFSN